jgi:hypothetical protein
MSRKPFVLALVGCMTAALAGSAAAQNRVSASQKGSVLIYSKIEIKWENVGGQWEVIQDTFLDMANDFPENVRVKGYLINGDTELEEICGGEPEDCVNMLIQEEEPGWNTANCAFTLTGNQPSFWSAAQGFTGDLAFGNGGFTCQSFTLLDPIGPGRPDLESGDPDNFRVLRGYAIFWAEGLFPLQVPPPGGDTHVFLPINWNHLKGDAVIVNYKYGTAWEYNAWAFRALVGVRGEPTTLETPFGSQWMARLALDGIVYDAAFSSLLLDFYGTGSTALSGGGVDVVVDTDLTVHAVSADVRQDGCGPVLTKVEAEIWNEFETKFSGTRRCVCCWDQTMLDDWVRSVSVPNHFTRSALRTDKGKARLVGLASVECDYESLCGPTAALKRFRPGCQQPSSTAGLLQSENAALLGLATKFLAFDGADEYEATAGMNLVGMGEMRADIVYMLQTAGSTLRDGSDDGSDSGSRKLRSRESTNERGSTIRSSR